MLVWASSRIEIEIGRLLLLFIISLLARFAVTPNILSLFLSLSLSLLAVGGSQTSHRDSHRCYIALRAQNAK